MSQSLACGAIIIPNICLESTFQLCWEERHVDHWNLFEPMIAINHQPTIHPPSCRGYMPFLLLVYMILKLHHLLKSKKENLPNIVGAAIDIY